MLGGVVLIAIDFAGLHDYVRINPRLRTLDSYIEVLVDSGFIDDEIVERCELEGTFTVTRNIQISLSARMDRDSDFCNDASERLAAAINNPSSISDDPRFAQVPEVLQFASAAVAAPNTISTASLEGGNGAQPFASLSFVVLMLLAAFVLVILM